MDNIVENILAIDRAATEIIKKAEIAKQRVLEETALEKSRLLEEANSRLDEKVKEYQGTADEKLKEQIEQINKIHLDRMSLLQSSFNTKSAQIEDSIVSAIINGEE